MKRNFTLVLFISIAIMQLANAKTILNKCAPKPINKKGNSFTRKKMMGNPYQDNKIYFYLLSKATTDTAYTYNGVWCESVFDSTFLSTSDNAGNQQDLNIGFGFGEDLSVLINNSNWQIRCWNLPTPKDTINLDLVRPQLLTDYQLQIDASGYTAHGVTAYLYDNYTKKLTKLDSLTTNINFTPNIDSAATFQNRFSVVFKSNSLPIKNISLNTLLKNNAVQINWNTSGESNVANFSLEKSVDGTHYNTINTIAAKNISTATYSYTDNSATTGTVYYRIKATSNTGATTYSSVSAINKAVTTNSFGVYPNPVRGNVLSLKLTNIVSGSYTISIYSTLGQKVSSQQLQHNGGTASYNLSLNNNLASGLYKLSIVSATDKKAVYETSLVIKK